jgi:hypothetical protein
MRRIRARSSRHAPRSSAKPARPARPARVRPSTISSSSSGPESHSSTPPQRSVVHILLRQRHLHRQHVPRGRAPSRRPAGARGSRSSHPHLRERPASAPPRTRRGRSAAGSCRRSRPARSPSAASSGRFRSVAFTTLNIVVFTPMPSARVRTATAVKPGFRMRRRKAYRTSLRKVSIVMPAPNGTLMRRKQPHSVDCRHCGAGLPPCFGRHPSQRGRKRTAQPPRTTMRPDYDARGFDRRLARFSPGVHLSCHCTERF